MSRFGHFVVRQIKDYTFTVHQKLYLVSSGCQPDDTALPCVGLSDKTVHSWTIMVRDYPNMIFKVLELGFILTSHIPPMSPDVTDG